MASVLVVDDDDAVRESMCDVLAARGHVVGSAADGLQALEMLARLPDVECLVLDMHMPRLDGQGVLDALDGGPAVVVVSAFEYVSRAETEARYAEKICAVLVKPVLPPVLLSTVEKCVGRPEQSDDPRLDEQAPRNIAWHGE